MKELQERLAELVGEDGVEHVAGYCSPQSKPIPELIEIAEKQFIDGHPHGSVESAKYGTSPPNGVARHWRLWGNGTYTVSEESGDTKQEACVKCAIAGLERKNHINSE